MDDNQFVSKVLAKKILTRVGVAMAMVGMAIMASAFVTRALWTGLDEVRSVARSAGSEADEIAVEAWAKGYAAIQSIDVVKSELERLRTRVTTLESDLEDVKAFGDLWDECILDIQVKQRVELDRIKAKVEHVETHDCHDGSIVMKWTPGEMPTVTTCEAKGIYVEPASNTIRTDRLTVDYPNKYCIGPCPPYEVAH